MKHSFREDKILVVLLLVSCALEHSTKVVPRTQYKSSPMSLIRGILCNQAGIIQLGNPAFILQQERFLEYILELITSQAFI